MAYTRRWIKPRPEARICDKCGKSYHRRNLVEAWDTQNPGHRTGWNKTRLRICTNCAGANTAQRTLMVASIIKVPGNPKTPTP